MNDVKISTVWQTRHSDCLHKGQGDIAPHILQRSLASQGTPFFQGGLGKSCRTMLFFFNCSR